MRLITLKQKILKAADVEVILKNGGKIVVNSAISFFKIQVLESDNEIVGTLRCDTYFKWLSKEKIVSEKPYGDTYIFNNTCC